MIGIGTGMTALVLGATIAARWFAARRGLVVGILTASVATWQLVFLPLLASLTERMGWRIALALGRDFGDQVQVTAGLAGGEAVVVGDPPPLRDGQPVTVAGAR